MEKMYDAKELAELLSLRHRKTGALVPKRAYELPIRKHHLDGVGVRWAESDVLMYIHRHAA